MGTEEMSATAEAVVLTGQRGRGWCQRGGLRLSYIPLKLGQGAVLERENGQKEGRRILLFGQVKTLFLDLSFWENTLRREHSRK